MNRVTRYHTGKQTGLPLKKISPERRNPIKRFDRNLIRDYLGKADIRSVELFQLGKSNTNYKVSLTDGRICVLRLYSQGDIEREAVIRSLVREVLPVPEELDRGDGWSLFSYLEGRPLCDLPEFTRLAGHAIARLSSISFEASGIIGVDGKVTPHQSGSVTGLIKTYLGQQIVQDWLGQRRLDLLYPILEKERERFSELEAGRSLVHGDFNPTNILVNKRSLSGILDWEFAHAGSFYADIDALFRFTPPQFHRDIKIGFEMTGRSLRQDWLELTELISLTHHLECFSPRYPGHVKFERIDIIDRLIDKFG